MEGLKPLVAVIMGSDSDLPIMEGAAEILEDFDVPYEMAILSAHRTPEEAAHYASNARNRGIKVIIAGAGWAAHLAGVLAAGTTLPVIGVPIDSSPLNGWDALLATVQMPPGIPVATMALGRAGARNAALLAIQILSLDDERLSQRILAFKSEMAQAVLDKNQKIDRPLRVPGLGE